MAETTGLKSAWERALERMGGGKVTMVELRDDQKDAIADVNRRMQAKVAEIDILFADKIAAVANEPDKQQDVEAQKVSAIRKAREAAERDIEAIRNRTA